MSRKGKGVWRLDQSADQEQVVLPTGLTPWGMFEDFYIKKWKRKGPSSGRLWPEGCGGSLESWPVPLEPGPGRRAE